MTEELEPVPQKNTERAGADAGNHAARDENGGNLPIGQDALDRLQQEAFQIDQNLWRPTLATLSHSSIMDEVNSDKQGSTTLDNLVRDSRIARLGLVSVEGLAYTVPGIAKGAMHDFTNPGEALAKAGGAYSLGVGLRTLLPRAGAGRAAAAGIFTYYLVKDAAVPVMGAWSDAWDARNHNQIKIAAEKAGDGLGMFAWDAYWGMKIAGWGERGAERAMRGAMGDSRFNAFEAKKGDFFGSDQYFFGRHLNNLTRNVDNLTGRLSDRLSSKAKTAEPEISVSEKLRRIQEAEAQTLVNAELREIHWTGLKTVDGKPLGYSQSIDLLLQGQNPRTMKAEQALGNARVETAVNPSVVEMPGFKIDLASGRVLQADVLARGLETAKFRWHGGDKGLTVEYFDSSGKLVSRVRSNDFDATRTNTNHKWDVEYFKGDVSLGKTSWEGSLALKPVEGRFAFEPSSGGVSPRGPNWEYHRFAERASQQGNSLLQAVEPLRISAESAPPPGANSNSTGGAARETAKTTEKPVEKATEKSSETNPSDLVSKIEGELSLANMTLVAKMNRQDMNRWTEERQQIVDMVEGAVGPVHAALNPRHRAMDQGYGEFRDQMIGLGNQVKTTPDLQQVSPLFFRARDAAVQHMSQNLGPTGKLTHELNLFAHEIHTGLKRGMEKAGVPAQEVLSAKNPPINQVAYDRGFGPHTIPEINGVWDVDLVHFPRNMVGTRSITTSGIYGHEFGHNQYGGILRFAESIRERVINDAVTEGLRAYGQKHGIKDLANQSMEVPGVGTMTKQQVIVEILKAQANENTSDMWSAAWTGPNAGTALGVLLQSLRSGGKLETRNVFGNEFRARDNPLGIEVHPNDAFRPMLVAEVIRQRANGEPLLLEYARNMDRYAREASLEGDYIWASLDAPGKSIRIPRAELEAIIPALVKAQLNTPLPALKGKAFGEILPDLPTHVRQMDRLADGMVDAVLKGKGPEHIPFNTTDYTINQVFGAGLPATLRLVDRGMSAAEANAHVNRMSDHLRQQFHAHDPHIDPLTKSSGIGQLILDPMQAISGIRDVTGSALRNQPRMRDWADRNANLFLGYTGMRTGRSLYSSMVAPGYEPGMYNLNPSGDLENSARNGERVDIPLQTQPQERSANLGERKSESGQPQPGKPEDRDINRPEVKDDLNRRSGLPRDIPRPFDPFLPNSSLLNSSRSKSTILDGAELESMSKQGRSILGRGFGDAVETAK